MRLFAALCLFLMLLLNVSCATTIKSQGSKQASDRISVSVKAHDTLNTIAKHYQTDWRVIVRLNQDLLSQELLVGQLLNVIPGLSFEDSDFLLNDEIVQGADEPESDDDFQFKPKTPIMGPHSSEPAGLIFPVEGYVSSHFGKRRRRLHKGIDLVANIGTPIVAAADGEVIFSGRIRGYGSTVVVDHGQFMTLYAHASKLIAKRGNRVRQGDFIAKVGRSGNARGVHLHFELRDSENQAINPIPYLQRRSIAKASQSNDKVSSAVSPAKKVGTANVKIQKRTKHVRIARKAGGRKPLRRAVAASK